MPSTQYRIIDGTLYKRESDPYAFDLRVHDLGRGEVEALSLPRYGWSEVGPVSASALENAEMARDHVFREGEWVKPSPTDREIEEKAAENRERSARRARTQVRRLVRSKNLDTLLTLTYRENVTDRDRMARDFDVFMKRIRRIFPAFQYVCVFERQKRGAWHAHIAVERVQSHYLHKGVLIKSFDLLRSVWRAVVTEGNIDVSKSKSKRQRTLAKIASYMSKYIGKGFENDQDGDSYRASGRALPKPAVFRVNTSNLHAAGGALLQLLQDFWPSLPNLHMSTLDCKGYYMSLSP